MSEALAIIGQLYRYEEAIRQHKLLGQAKQDYRARHCLAEVGTFFGWLHTQRNRHDLLGSDPFAKALA